MNFRNPVYLTHPNIPKPLHGMNPRSLLGKEWWDIHRREAYATQDYHCWACGIHKRDARYHQWLEGHEGYDINYKTGEVKLNEIIALCHSCHNFIHSGRMQMMLRSGETDRDKVLYILNRGLMILDEVGLDPFYGTVMLWNQITGEDRSYTIDDSYTAPWNQWHLIIEGKKYYSKFKNMQEWANYYQ